MAFNASDWGRRVLLTGLTPSASFSGFVALVSLDNLPVESIDAGTNSAINGGGDLRFSTDSAGVNQLPLEVVSYVTSATESSRYVQLWIRFPTYASGTREVYMFYKKAGETQPAVVAAFGRNEVWQDREYQYNLFDSSAIIDSTGVTTPTVSGTPTDDQTSPFGSGVRFGISEFIDLEQNVGDTTGDITLRAWINPNTSNSFGTIISIRDGGSFSYQWRLEALDPAILIGSSSPDSPGPDLLIGTWVQLTLTVSGTTITYYRDGSSLGTQTVTGDRSLNSSIDTFIGNQQLGAPLHDILSSLANVSASFGAISSDLISSEYDNQNNTSTFWTTGTPEDTSTDISVTEQLKNINYASLDPVITLTGALSITENLVNTDYNALNPAITLTGVISITEQLNNVNYTSLDPIIDLTGLVDIIESTVNTNYISLNPSILLTPEPIGIVSTACFNGDIERLVFDGFISQLGFGGNIESHALNGTIERLETNGNIQELEFNGNSKRLVFNGTISTIC